MTINSPSTSKPATCRWEVHECPDDMCRNSVERGLCGKWVVDAFEDWGDDGHDDDWWDEITDNNVPGQHT